MLRILAALFLLAIQTIGVDGLSVKPKELAEEKLDGLVKSAHAVSWHKNATPTVPANIKAEVRRARTARENSGKTREPRVLYVTSPLDQVQEVTYELVDSMRPNGEPLWKEQNHTKWLYAGVDGRWHIGGVAEKAKRFACDSGYIHGSTLHKGSMPNMVSGLWALDDDRLPVNQARSEAEISVSSQSKAKKNSVHHMFGGCGHHIPIKNLGLVSSPKAAALLGFGATTRSAVPDWEVTSGSGCSIDGHCARSTAQGEIYDNHDICEITVNAPRPLEVERFETEGYFDKLTVNGQVYTGRGITAGPEGVIPSGKITWSSDFSVLYGGWKICLEQPQEHEGTNSYAMPGVGASQVVADNGLDESGIVNGEEPFVKVMKDGFFEVGCYFDVMLASADKFGNDKDKYDNQQNVSIAKYNELVLKMEQHTMTPTICFQFCRTIRGMVNFGITNGNECYCTPYFNPRGGDEGTCDVGCQGDQTVMCGNAEGKSSVWEMHLCGDTAEDLKENIVAAEEALTYFHESGALAVDLGFKMRDAGAALQKVAGLCGSSSSADLGQEANKAGGELTNSWMPGRKPYESLLGATKTAEELEGEDFTVATTATQAENAISIIKDNERTVLGLAKGIHQLVKSAYPAAEYQAFGGDDVVDNLAKELRSGAKALDFRLASYAMGERDLEPKASACSGKTIGLPMVGIGVNGCGIACEQTLYPTKCVGFSHYHVDGTEDLCFLFSDVHDVEVFEKTGGAAGALLQRKDKSTRKAAAVCKIKLTEIRFGYKPKGELKKKTRCFGDCDGFTAREGVENFSVPSDIIIGGKKVLEKYL